MADINWNDIIGDKTVSNGGYAGDLMSVARAHIQDAKDSQQITQEQAGEIYSAMIPTAITGAIKYAMDEQLVEAQIEKANAEVELARTQADREYVLTLASVDKVYGYDYTLDGEGNIDRATLTDAGDGQMDNEAQLTLEKVESEALNNATDGLIESQILGIIKDNLVKDEQILMSTYERTDIQPKQLEKLDEEIDILQSQDLEVIASTVRNDLQVQLSKIPSTLN